MTVRHRVALALAGVLAVGALRMWAVAADPAKVDPKAAAAKDEPQFASAACSACHNGDPNHPYKKYGSHEFIRLNEGPTWDTYDPHQNAFEALESELGKRMGAALKYKDPRPQTWTDCLTCHAVDKYALGDRLHPDAEKKLGTGERFATSGGVGCVGCHGVTKEWQHEHYKEPDQQPSSPPWREKSPKEKTDAGQRDLRDPMVRANLCVSCHVGSATLGRIVTHEMYAVGHPPLPPFELATYQKGEPAHWDHPSTLPYFKTVDAKDHWPRFHFHADENATARDVVAGAVAAARAEAELLRVDAERVLNDRQAGNGIDFARFDCASCHHDLKFPSDRQLRKTDGPPGRPPLRASVRYLAEVVAGHAAETGPDTLKAKAGEFGDKWTALRKAATDRPFGDPDKVKAAAADVEKWCNDFLMLQSNARYTPEVAGKLRERIGAAATRTRVADPEAAMVLAWAYLALSDRPVSLDQAAAFEKVLPLSVRPPGALAKTPSGTPIPVGYAERQRKANAFRAADFEKAFDALRQSK